jgi:fructuronate reductase
MRLSAATVGGIPASVQHPTYDRAAQAAGIVHFGIGAFHRAHQAVYTDAAMNAGDRNWGIIGVSLRSAGVAEQMNPQDGLYTVAARSGEGVDHRLIGSVQRALVASQEPNAVIEVVAAETTRIISFTITEKGYCRASDGSLDLALADNRSVYRFLKDGLSLRRKRGLAGVTLLSCDNLAQNGEQLERLLTAYVAECDPTLGEWVKANCSFPSSMVDRIVPATTAADLLAAQTALGGLHDTAHVVTERFTQWVIEDSFVQGRPRWEDFGAELVADVAPYETAKLRMLNGAHSALAYLGLQRGYEFVHQAIGDNSLRSLASQLMRDEAAPTIDTAAGQDLMVYADSLLERFANPALNHKLAQIAMDGSQKIPQRWLDTLAVHQQRGRRCPAMLEALATWTVHVSGRRHAVDDPMRDVLQELWHQTGKVGIAGALFGKGGLFSNYWQGEYGDISEISAKLETLI